MGGKIDGQSPIDAENGFFIPKYTYSTGGNVPCQKILCLPIRMKKEQPIEVRGIDGF